MGEQIKQALEKLKEFWKNLSPKLKKTTVFIASGVVAFAVIITLFLNLSGNGYTLLYPAMEQDESKEVYAILQELEIDVRLDEKGRIMVPKNQVNNATAQMAMKHYPQQTLPYTISDNGMGLTSTDAERQVRNVQQTQNRMQDTIRQFDGVKNAIVTLNLAQQSNRVWEENTQKSTGSVTLFLHPGVTLSKEQVSGIKYLIASNTGMEAGDVVVYDAGTNLSLKSTEDDVDGLGGSLDFENQIERKLVDKAMNVLSIALSPEQVRVSATVVVDYKKMLSEKKEYTPSPDSKNNAGVLQHEDSTLDQSGTGVAQGIAGEEDNTDTPSYLNADGTLNEALLSRTDSKDYVVSYITEQINSDKAQLQSASMSVTLKDPIDDITKEAMLASVSKATNIPEESISIANFVLTPDLGPVDPTGGEDFELKSLIIPGSAALVAIIIIVILMAVLRSKAKRKKEAAINAEANALQEARLNMQREFEERKRQLKVTAETNSQDEQITNEVRDFAKANPEITANLLRVWLKEDSE